MTNKKQLSETDICVKYITPDIKKAEWDESQFRREVFFTDGKNYVKGKLTTRGKRKFADYILYYKPNIPIAIVEAKDNKHSVEAGLEQALEYAEILDLPFAFSSNGDGFVFHDKTAGENEDLETTLNRDEFPSPDTLWQKYKAYKNITEEQEEIVLQDYYLDRGGRKPRRHVFIEVNNHAA